MYIHTSLVGICNYASMQIIIIYLSKYYHCSHGVIFFTEPGFVKLMDPHECRFFKILYKNSKIFFF